MSNNGIPSFSPPDKRLRPVYPRVPTLAVSAKTLTPFGEFVNALVKQVQQAQVNNWVTNLVNFPTRHTSSAQNIEVAKWLRSKFRSFGYADVTFHNFTYNALTRHNVICTKLGVTDPGKKIIICAHYDSLSNNLDSTVVAPGADDNASGVAGLLEIARVLRNIDTSYSIQLAAFSGEEQGLVGSAAYANTASTNGLQIPLLINLDMIGHPIDPVDPQIIIEQDMGNVVSTNDVASQTFAMQMVQDAADFTTIKTSLGPIYGSDYMPFEHFGYVCIGAYDGADITPFYHTSNDTLDKVNMGFCTEVIRMVLATVLNVAGKKIGAALIFDPDPITTSGNTTLTTLSPELNDLRSPVSLKGLNPADASGKYHLSGTNCHIMDVVSPMIAPSESIDGVFVFKRNDTGFKDGMAYFHIDTFYRYLQTLGFTLPSLTPANIDVHGNTSHYDPITSDIVFAAADGVSPSDAEDAGMILHQYAHAIQDTQNPGFISSSGLGSGFGDLLPALYYDHKHANWSTTRGLTAPWAGSGRRYDRIWNFDNSSIVGESARGEIWASTLFEIYLKIGGGSSHLIHRQFARDLMLKLHLMANSMVPVSGANPTQMAQQLEAADNNLEGWRSLANGLHQKVIYDTFQQRNLFGYPPLPVDVYIDDGRNGGYDFLQRFWNCEDLVVRRNSTDSPTMGHEQPILNQPNYLWAKVKRKGSGDLGTVNVKAFSCSPGTGLIWPVHWTATTPTSIPATTLGTSTEEWVGPFEFVPTEENHSCILAIVEAENDPANTETLVGNVSHGLLVPFDNNIAQRNLSPVSGGGGKQSRRFRVINSTNHFASISLDVQHDLPKAWKIDFDVPNIKDISLPPYGERWVTLRVDIPPDAEFQNRSERARVAIESLVDGIPDGGMTFDFVHPSLYNPVEKPQKIRVKVEQIQILNDHDPFLKGKGEFRFHARIKTDTITSPVEVKFPKQGAYSISDHPGKNIVKLNEVLYEGTVNEYLAIQVMGIEMDTFDPDDNLCSYKRIFTGKSDSWFGVMGPNDETIEPEDLGDWRIWYRIEKI